MATNDLFQEDFREEQRKHKAKRIIPQPNSFFYKVKDTESNEIQPLFSHASQVQQCSKTGKPLNQPTGGSTKLPEKLRVMRLHDSGIKNCQDYQ